MKERPEKKYRLSTSARLVRRGAEDDAVSERQGKDRYEYYDSPAGDFDNFFAEVLAPLSSIRHYAESHFEAKRGEAIGIELGGPARKLFREINHDGLFRKTAGFVLNDRRTDAERLEDQSHNHEVVEADVFFKDGAEGLSWRTIEQWVQKNGKPDLIVERMVQGVQLIRRADLFVAIVKRWLSQLSDGGVLLAEISHQMPYEEREKVFTLLHDDSILAEEIASDTDITSLLIRRA